MSVLNTETENSRYGTGIVLKGTECIHRQEVINGFKKSIM